MDAGDWGLEGRPQWWWKYVNPGSIKVNPIPDPWIQGVTSALLSAISMKDVARRMPEGEIQQQLLSRSDTFISELLDDFCGTGPRPWPWPWPGPRPWIFPAVAQLTLIASTMNKGEIREEVQRVADDMVQRAVREQ
jgi:hypothetical protein